MRLGYAANRPREADGPTFAAHKLVQRGKLGVHPSHIVSLPLLRVAVGAPALLVAVEAG